jgi:hypothetical protein
MEYMMREREREREREYVEGGMRELDDEAFKNHCVRYFFSYHEALTHFFHSHRYMSLPLLINTRKLSCAYENLYIVYMYIDQFLLNHFLFHESLADVGFMWIQWLQSMSYKITPE